MELNMNTDMLMLGAFALFLGLVFWRWWQMRRENQDQESVVPIGGYRKVFRIIQVVILVALLIYMLPLLWKDVQDIEQVAWSAFLLRCLIFVITIYTLIFRIRDLLTKRNR